MKITIEINTGNAAFEDNENEVYEIVKKVANSAKDHFVARNAVESGNLRDSNGNTVGKYKITGK